VVLAAGEGSRLQALTMTASGVAVPKQFCSLGGGDSLLHAALTRARAVAPAERTCVVLAEHHRRWWQPLMLGVPAGNAIQQPSNRGTANGILLPLLHILHRDPEAMLLVLPSDHFVKNETVMAASLRSAMAHVEEERDHHLLLLGLTPEEHDPELGYIVADGDDPARVRAVSEFVEKPSATAARALIARGAVWNSFIFAARGQALLRAFEARCPDIVGEMQHIVTGTDPAACRIQLVRLYESLPHVDFSRDILQSSPMLLHVLTVPPCGWSDLGTPRRVGEAVDRYDPMARERSARPGGGAAFLDLAVRYLQLRDVSCPMPAQS
jgi:mannose-1-phosphate guanylyltransferase